MRNDLCYFTEVRALVDYGELVLCSICVIVRCVKWTGCFTSAHQFNTEYSFLFCPVQIRILPLIYPGDESEW